MKNMQLALLVSNHSGILTKVAGLFGRRGCNIRSLMMNETSLPEISCIHVLACGSDDSLTQIYKQVKKLEDVRLAALVDGDHAQGKEAALVKIQGGSVTHLPEATTKGLMTQSRYELDGSLAIELFGSSLEVERFLSGLSTDGEVEVLRSSIGVMPFKEQKEGLKRTS